ncbi:carboxymuconolactone decarboxylase family protein [Corynebacterium auris]|uniref:carboxymuconolactone decarboxylase family protein n=1 Tax=Corynebacterium auris TaxID=44750 RepID=UPI0025B43992|nr:carboxymuconolactone decarboxylase family protein [Corynebacterium auris]WJY67012.1 Carboxymuconolactone decarboxylase family protein [Corynebacterium auris]
MNKIPPSPIHKRFSVAALALEAASRAVSRETRILVQLRASFLNGCGYCIDMHTKEARKSGWSEQKIAILRDTAPGEWQAGDMSERERLILEFTDAGTLLSETPLSYRENIRERVHNEFGPETTGELIAAITAINMWNRIGILSGK